MSPVHGPITLIPDFVEPDTFRYRPRGRVRQTCNWTKETREDASPVGLQLCSALHTCQTAAVTGKLCAALVSG